MNVQQLLDAVRDSLTVQRVFGEPYERDGLTIIPVARLHGGGGGGGGEDSNGSSGQGGGFGLSAKPAGVYVIAGGKVRWEPALDLNRIVVGGQILAVLALLIVRSILQSRQPSTG